MQPSARFLLPLVTFRSCLLLQAPFQLVLGSSWYIFGVQLGSNGSQNVAKAAQEVPKGCTNVPARLDFSEHSGTCFLCFRVSRVDSVFHSGPMSAQIPSSFSGVNEVCSNIVPYSQEPPLTVLDFIMPLLLFR